MIKVTFRGRVVATYSNYKEAVRFAKRMGFRPDETRYVTA